MLFNDLKVLKNEALKNNDNIKKNLLSTLIAEASKNDKEPKDEIVISTIRKFINNNNEVLKLKHIELLLIENTILTNLLPQSLSEQQIIDILKEYKFISIAQCMKFFKDNYQNRYDGKSLNNLFNNMGAMNG
jgi:uncharacterized protein YqeY